jgi:hypothetical protein
MAGGSCLTNEPFNPEDADGAYRAVGRWGCDMSSYLPAESNLQCGS